MPLKHTIFNLLQIIENTALICSSFMSILTFSIRKIFLYDLLYHLILLDCDEIIQFLMKI